ncbi:MAG: UvrB/UvrC motif-containing protein [Treponema sp.]|nr:UvrB/UvrC motif-containing protein [Treponema sp.]
MNYGENLVCPACGTSLSSIKNTLKTGCPECYASFDSYIRDILRDFGVNSTYTGQLPKKLPRFRNVLTDRILIQNKLQESLKNEDYEKAAFYRDYLKAIEKSPVQGSEHLDN